MNSLNKRPIVNNVTKLKMIIIDKSSNVTNRILPKRILEIDSPPVLEKLIKTIAKDRLQYSNTAKIESPLIRVDVLSLVIPKEVKIVNIKADQK